MEVNECGFAVRELTGSLTGEALSESSREIAMIAEMTPLRV